MRGLKRTFYIALCAALLLTQVSFVYATEDAEQSLPTTDSVQKEVTEQETDEVKIEADETEQTLKLTTEEGEEATATDGVITPAMTQEEIEAAIKKESEEVTVQAGNYEDKDLIVSDKSIKILAGDETTTFRFVKLNGGKLILKNDFSVNPKGVIVPSDKSALELNNAVVEGNNKALKVYCTNTGCKEPSAYAMSAQGKSVTLKNLKLTVSGSNGDRGLLNINSEVFAAYESNLQICGNEGKNMWGNAGAPNICVGHDSVCATRSILFESCTVNASKSAHPYGDGMQINKTEDNCEITFKSCKVNFDGNGGNGFMANPTEKSEKSKHVVFIDSDVSICGNGAGKSGACIGFANAAIELKNTENKEHTFEVSNNYKLGIAANNLNKCTSINATGYTVIANGNGAEVTSSPQPYGYGMYLMRNGSSFENCVLIAEKNQKDGITLGGSEPVTLSDSEVRAVQNGSNGLVMRAEETVFSNAEILSCCNGAIKGDEVDTTAEGKVVFTDSKGSIGRLILNENASSDGNSHIVALYDGESTAVTAGDSIYLLDKDGTVKEVREGDLCHHAIDWEQGEIRSNPTETEYGSLDAPCSVCGETVETEPLVRVVYDKNTEDEVENLPEEVINMPYISDISVSSNPVRKGYNFTGWYLNSDSSNETDGVISVKKPTVTLYAGWEKVAVAGGGSTQDAIVTPQKPDAHNNAAAHQATTARRAATTGVATANYAAAPLAAHVNTEGADAVQTRNIDDGAVPLASGSELTTDSWSLVNFALMNLAVFESIMLLIGYFVRTKNSEEEQYENELKKKGIIRLISIPIAIIAVVLFVLTEDISKTTAFVDGYTVWMVLIALAQTVAVALSKKKYENTLQIQTEK